jgi:hypothetical protein
MFMPRPRAGTELEALQAQEVAIQKKIKEVAAREKAKRELEDSRRQQIAGAAALDHMSADPRSPFAATLLGLVNRRARSAADRALFVLAPLPKEEAEKALSVANGEAS